jgi:ABC-type glycerol-3-phosphate transport system substrate-binding protein
LRSKKLIVLLASVGLVLALVLTGCAGNGDGGGQTVVEVEPTLQVLNPQGIPGEVELHSLAPRIDSLEGKTILFYESEANNQQLPELLKQMEARYPNTTFDTIYTEGFGDEIPTDEQKTYDACIRGIAW